MDKEHKEHSVNQEEKKDDFSLDIKSIPKKIQALFNSERKKNPENHKTQALSQNSTHQHSTNESHHSSQEIDLKVMFTKHLKWIIPLLFIIIAFSFSTYFRGQTLSLPMTEDWAHNTVYNLYHNQIEQQINQQYPNLPPANRKALVDQEFQKAVNQNQDRIQQDVKALSQQYKDQFQDDNGDTYLLEIDPYLWYSEARNYLQTGHLGDEEKNGKWYFSLRDGRNDKQVSVQLNPYVGAYLYYTLRIFNPNISLMHAMFFLPIMLIGLSLIPAFFIGRKIAGNVGGFFAATLLAINGALLVRTPAGFSDTDPYNILFPLLAVWLFIESYSAQKRSYRITLAALTGLTIAIHSTAWTGWWYSFLFILAAIVIETILWIYQHRREIKLFKENLLDRAFILGTIILVTGIFVSWLQNFANFSRAFIRPFQFIALKEVGIKTIWPNVLTTVAEFNTVSWDQIINSMGGKLLFMLAILGIVSLVWYARKQRKDDTITAIIILIWFVGTAYASTKGVRFGILMAPAFALAVGFGLGFIYRWARKWFEQDMKMPKVASIILISILLCATLLGPLSDAYNVSRNLVPNINDSWVDMLTKIKNDEPRAIITSWWDFGHWFYTISERMVTFDGGDQGERIYWVGKTLLTKNEAEAIGTLRMLNCAQESAPHKLDEFTHDSLKSITIINQINLIADREKAREKYLEFELTTEQAEIMLNYTHCQDFIPNYFITSQDMIGKSGVWGHFGAWDFERAQAYQTVQKMNNRGEAVAHLATAFNKTTQQAEQVYNEIQSTPGDRWIAPWPGYIAGPNGCTNVDNRTVTCSFQLQGQKVTIKVDLPTKTVTLEGVNGIVPNSLVYATTKDVVEKEQIGNKAGFSAILIPQNEAGTDYAMLLADPLQASSMFTRLFFFNAQGLKCFQRFDNKQQITGELILTWKIDWTCSQDYTPFAHLTR